MWGYVLRRVLYNVPVYLAILLALFLMLRIHDPVHAYMGKNQDVEDMENLRVQFGLDKPIYHQFGVFLGEIVRLDFSQDSWNRPGESVGEILAKSAVPSLLITVPALLLTTLLSITVGLISSYYRGRFPDRALVFIAVLGMCISFAVYVLLGQYFAAHKLGVFLKESFGWERGLFAVYDEAGIGDWAHYYLLPVLISVTVAMGYDTRFYRAVMVEEGTRDYITTAMAKGAGKRKILFVHMLKNAMIPIISRVMTTFPFLITGSFLLEEYFNIPGMGRALLTAIHSKDFPVIQVFTAIFAAVFILSNILTDVLYAAVDPRVRLR